MCDGQTGNKNLPDGLLCPAADITVGHRLSFAEGSCRIHCIEQNVAAISRMSAAPSLRFASPQAKCESTIRGCQSTTANWLRPRSWARWPTDASGFDSSDLADGVFADAAYRFVFSYCDPGRLCLNVSCPFQQSHATEPARCHLS